MIKNFQHICDEFGIPLAEEKTQGPVKCPFFLGLEIDTVEQCIRIPRSNSLELEDLLRIF